MKKPLALIHTTPGDHEASLLQRILLYPGELYRIPACYRCLRVIAGTALVTQVARDFVLAPGHETLLDVRGDDALVSSMRNQQAVVEIYGAGG